MMLNRSVRWRGLDPDSIEQGHVLANGRDTRIRGAIVGPDFGLFYRIRLDERGHTRTVKIERTDGRQLELFADGAGSWSDDRAEPIPALHGCIDVDIWPTPMTNSLPIWRTEWADQPVRFAMAWIDATEMTFRRSEQIYTPLPDGRFRFQSADFEAVLDVDEEGMIIDYPGLFTRETTKG
jgi:hypothetical protein